MAFIIFNHFSKIFNVCHKIFMNHDLKPTKIMD